MNISEEIKNRIIEEIKACEKSYRIIAEENGVKVSDVKTIARKYNVTRKEKVTVLTDETRQEIFKRIQVGDKNYREIAEEFNLNKSTIAKIARENGVLRKKHFKALTDEEKNNILKLVKDGKTYTEIAEQLGLTISCISKIAIKNDIRMKKKGERKEPTEITPLIREKALELIKKGDIPYREIGEKLGVGRTTINRIAKENNIARDYDKRREMTKKTFLEKYGVENPFNVEEIREKREKTNIERYGVNHPAKSKEIQEKIQKTNLERYGQTNTLFLKQCVLKGGHSKIEEKFANKLKEYGIKYDDREYPINGKRYDFKIEDILVEINPFATHNSTWGIKDRKPLDKDYHYQKSKIAEENGFHCIHIWDWDDEDKIIKTFLKPKDKIYARECEIKETSDKEANEFIEKYHLQGKCNGNKINIGLYYKEELVEIMAFGNPRYNKNYKYEILRLCSSKTVIGGSEKIFKYFINTYNPKNVISYCDYGKFNGEVYKKLNFKLKSHNISKHWYNPKTKRHITDNLLRQKGYDLLMKASYGKGTDNKELMLQDGFVEIYDAGQQTWIYEKV